MTLEDFQKSKTPESRTIYVLLLLGLLAAVNGGWRLWAESPSSIEILTAAVTAAIALAVLRYVGQRSGK